MTTEDVARVRELFDEALEETFDRLFQTPDVVEVVSAVAEGDLAIVITGDSLRVVAVDTQEHAVESEPAPRPEVGTGCYL